MTLNTRSSKRKLSTEPETLDEAIQKKVKIDETDNVVNENENIISQIECPMRQKLIKNMKLIEMPYSTLPFKLYLNDDCYLYTILSVDAKKAVISNEYGNGNGKVSFKIQVNSMFIALEYCRLSKSTDINTHDLQHEFNLSTELLDVLGEVLPKEPSDPLFSRCPFLDYSLKYNKFSVKLARQWVKSQRAQMKCSDDIKDLVLSIFVNKSLF